MRNRAMGMGDCGAKKNWSQASRNVRSVIEVPQVEDSPHRKRSAARPAQASHRLPDGYRIETQSEVPCREDRLDCTTTSQGGRRHRARAEHIAAGAGPPKISGISLCETAPPDQDLPF